MPVILHNTGGGGGLFKKVSDLVYKLKSTSSAVSLTSESYPSLPAMTILPSSGDWKVNGKNVSLLQDYVPSFTVTGTYASYIVEPYYITTDKESGILSIALCTNSTAYENVYIATVTDNTGLGITKLAQTHVTQTGGSAGDYSATFFSNVTKPVKIEINAKSRDSSYDYISCTAVFTLA